MCLCVLCSLYRLTALRLLTLRTTPTASTCRWRSSTRTKTACSRRWATQRARGTLTPFTTTSVRCDVVWIRRVSGQISQCRLKRSVKKRRTLWWRSRKLLNNCGFIGPKLDLSFIWSCFSWRWRMFADIEHQTGAASLFAAEHEPDLHQRIMGTWRPPGGSCRFIIWFGSCKTCREKASTYRFKFLF